MSKKRVNVSIALLFHQNQVLVGWREAQQHQGNKHEFPGGKVEEGETPEQACYREIQEEVGIQLESIQKFDHIVHEYEDLIVALHIFQAGVNTAQLAQIKAPWQWYNRAELRHLNFPKANSAMVERLYWPETIRIVNIGNETDLASRLNQSGVSYVRIKKPSVNDVQLTCALYRALPTICKIQGPEQGLIVNIDVWKQLDQESCQQIYAVHFSHQQLMQLELQEVPFQLKKIASCHDNHSIEKAIQLGMDAIFLSPVLDTPTHPEQTCMGWTCFQQLASQIHVPVFALGGMSPDLLDKAQQHGAYGIAGIRHF